MSSLLVLGAACSRGAWEVLLRSTEVVATGWG